MPTKLEIITLFPEYFSRPLQQSLLGKAQEKKLIEVVVINLRDFATDRHGTVDDRPFGGGGGMVLMVEPLDRCLSALGYQRQPSQETDRTKEKILITSAAGAKLNQTTAIQYSLCGRLTIICGHYLGVDERLMSLYPIEEVCIGDFVLSGGEPAAAVIVDAVARLVPGVMGNFESALDDSHMEGILGPPVYTRPAQYKNLEVPQVLVSGHHKDVRRYRRKEAIRKCVRNRPDLLKTVELSDEDVVLLKEIEANAETV